MGTSGHKRMRGCDDHVNKFSSWTVSAELLLPLAHERVKPRLQYQATCRVCSLWAPKNTFRARNHPKRVRKRMNLVDRLWRCDSCQFTCAIFAHVDSRRRRLALKRIRHDLVSVNVPSESERFTSDDSDESDHDADETNLNG